MMSWIKILTVALIPNPRVWIYIPANESISRICEHHCKNRWMSAFLTSGNGYTQICGFYFIVTLVLLSFLTSGTLASQQISNPRIVEHPENQYVAKNEPATLNCKAEGEPPPVISWYRNGEPVITANENPTSHRMLLPSGQLFFLRIIHNRNSKEDVGVYYCNATNPETRVSVISSNATLQIAVMGNDFREEPRGDEVAVGSEAVLTCKAPKGEPEPRVRWRKNSDPVKPSDRIDVDDQGTLRIRDVMKEDSGHYVCIAYNIGGEKESQVARLVVRERPRIVEGPKDVLVHENSDVSFHCRATGDPEPTIIWKKLDDQMPQGRLHILEDKSLKIERVRASDEGVYVCRAENSVGSQESEAKLTVHSQPSFILTPRDKVVGVGRRVIFRCEVTGNPAPAVFWNKDSSQTLMFPNHDHGRLSVSEDGSLTIDSVEKNDEGEYICKGLNIAGTAYAKAKLEVKDFDPRPPPIIHHGPQNQTLPINSVAMLRCSASGEPPPVIRWHRNSRVLPLRDSRFTLLDSGTLQMSDLRKSDTGIYTCKAISETGETSWSAALVVETPTNPSIIFHRTPEPSTFPGPPSKPTISDVTETSVHLAWKTNTNHGASPVYAYTVEYFSHETGDGWIVASSDITDQFYTLRGLRQDTAYRFLVRAQNSHGLSMPSPVTAPIRTKGVRPGGSRSSKPEYEIALVAEKLTGQLVFLNEAEAMSSTAVKLSWDVKKNQRFIEGFHVRYRAVQAGRGSNNDAPGKSQRPRPGTMPGDFTVETVAGGTTTMYTLSNLERNTQYEVHVQPFYLTVIGQESNTVHVTTLEEAPTAPPQDIIARMIGNNTMYLSWNPPPTQHINGMLRGYKIYLKANDQKLNRDIQINSSLDSVYIHNLSQDVSYHIQMSAVNKMGEGVRSPLIPIGERDKVGQSVVGEPWFIALLIGLVGAALWIVLCIFSVWLYKRRQGGKKLPNNTTRTVPILKPSDLSRNGGSSNLLNGYDIKEKIHVDSNPLNDSVYKESLYDPQSHSPTTPNTSFYLQQQLQQQQQQKQLMNGHTGHYANTNFLANSMGSGQSAFRPIHQQGGANYGPSPIHGSQEMCIRNDVSSTDSNNLGISNGYFNPNQKSEFCDFANSPMSEYGPINDHSMYNSTHPVLYLPPPPEHPPPSDIGTPPDSSPPSSPYNVGGRLMKGHPQSSMYSPNQRRHTDVKPQPKVPLRSDSYRGQNRDYTQNKSQIKTGSNRDYPYQHTQPNHESDSRRKDEYHQSSLEESSRGRDEGRGGKDGSFEGRDVYSPRAMSEPEYGISSCHRGYHLVPIKDGELCRHYSDTEGVQQLGPSPGAAFRMMMEHEYSPPSPAPEDPMLDHEGINNMDDPHSRVSRGRRPLHSGPGGVMSHSRDSPISEVGPLDYRDLESDMELPELLHDMNSPHGSTSDLELASSAVTMHGGAQHQWDGLMVSDNCSSVRSSLASSDGGSMQADADFASAVARAAQMSGLTVVGSTVIDSKNAARDKGKKASRQRSQRPQCTSPYSTDSNYSAVPHRPYPKSDRRKQLRDYSNGRQSDRSPSNGHEHQSPSMDAKPRPPVQAKPQLSKSSPDSNQAWHKYGKTSAGNGDSGMNSGRPDPDPAVKRANPLSAFDTRDTPIV